MKPDCTTHTETAVRTVFVVAHGVLADTVSDVREMLAEEKYVSLTYLSNETTRLPACNCPHLLFLDDGLSVYKQ